MPITKRDLEKYTFTTGAFIAPFFDKESNRWRWVVTSFDDDTWCDGNLIDPDEVAKTELGLANLTETE